jgi:hypothetical protein
MVGVDHDTRTRYCRPALARIGTRETQSLLAAYSRGRSMSRKSILLGIAIALLLVGGTGAVFILLIRNEPSEYQRASVEPGEERVAQSNTFFRDFTQLLTDAGNDSGDWEANFTDLQVNSYFEEGFIHSGVDEKLLPDGIRDPRVTIEQGKFRLMFRYGTGNFSSVITVELGVWLAGDEPNVVCLELLKFRAGSLPISAQSLLDRISDTLRRSNVEVTWYRHDGNPVAALKFSSDPQHSSVQLKTLRLEQGQVTIQGSSSDGSGVSNLLPPQWRWAFREPPTKAALAKN